uniref:C-C motif chemokine n=1 Tax=Chelydra serpentina TaxID=8475 RepID=A0A8C3SVY9_CHESE
SENSHSMCSALPAHRFSLPASGSNDALDCCLRTSQVPIPRKIVLDYVVQRIHDGCPIHAVVFITVRGKQLCAPPHAHWVRRLTERLDNPPPPNWGVFDD